MLAVENAPKPFKAMLRALEAGHDDLAFQYARQYVRYIGHVQSQNARLMSMTGKALEREGMAEPGQWKGGPDFVEDQEILERDLERSGIAAKSAGLDERTREMFEEAKAAERYRSLDERRLCGPSVYQQRGGSCWSCERHGPRRSAGGCLLLLLTERSWGARDGSGDRVAPPFRSEGKRGGFRHRQLQSRRSSTI